MQSNEPAMPSEMQAWCARRYGGPDVLVLKTVPVPRMRAHDVLLAVDECIALRELFAHDEHFEHDVSMDDDRGRTRPLP